MRGMIRRAMVVAGPVAVLLGLATGAASASGTLTASWSPATSPGAFSYNNGNPVNPGQSFAQIFTLTSSGRSATVALKITLTPAAGTPSSAFAASSDACTGTSLGPKKSCTITVTYTAPNTPGQTDQATLTATNVKGATVSVTLTGTVANGATSLQVSGPASVTAGQPAAFTVTALNASDNVATGYTGTVHFTSTDPQAQLPADSTLTNGVGTFTVILKTAGDQVVFATDTVTSAITGLTPVTVAPAAAVSLRVGGPASVTAGVTANFTVTALDPFGNVATGYTGTVQISNTDPQALLQPTELTFLPSENGVGGFQATFFKSGSQTVTATDTVTSTITGTTSVTVNPSAVAMLIMNVPPTAVAGQPVPFTVTAEDQFGNAATGTVHFTSTDTTAALPPDSTLTNGTGNFQVTFEQTGDQTITATDTANAAINASRVVAVGS